ncbi:hypothetical protein CAL20_09770 [Bordetella genomosp. 4]|uniref:MarR family transcriptional regulator n=1 Tax=Bordetella genomosp. 4 TaxID=463044 RepID=A0A261U6U4_9BORD|nr:hypothetical protein CAL20_09770 [Bordetella genomosp. 4]
MKYAREVIDLMACYPGRQFRMAEIMRHVGRCLSRSAAAEEAMRRGVRRVLDHLVDSGQVERSGGNTKAVAYFWRPVGQMSQYSPQLGQNIGQYGRDLAP